MSNTISHKTSTSSSRGQTGVVNESWQVQTELCWPLLKPSCSVTSLRESKSRRVQRVHRKLARWWGNSGWMGYTVATVRSPRVSAGPQVELTPVLTARHNPLWGNSAETVFHYLCCTWTVSSGWLRPHCACKKGRDHMQAGWADSSTVVCQFSTQ